MDVVLMGGLVNAARSLALASPTILIGAFIAALMRYYLGPDVTRRLFGGDSLRSLPQSWLLGMLLPVCSIGVLPIIRELYRIKLRPGAITAFALSAPLFNPLSLLYGLTLSRPYVILGFAGGSLLVVTIIGLVWDRLASQPEQNQPIKSFGHVGLARLRECAKFICSELCGPSGRLGLIALLGVGLLGASLPHAALQQSAEQGDSLAPLRMAMLSVPIYATPMQAISQLGMMFAHGNSPGAAFCLLLLGSGINLGTLWWLHRNYGAKATALWFSSLMVIVVSCAYIINKPLIPPGVEPAGHTHAFDVYSNPFTGKVTLSAVRQVFENSVGWAERISCCVLVLTVVLGTLLPQPQPPACNIPASSSSGRGLDRDVPPAVVGLTGMVGLIAMSIVGCYAYYPATEETLEEMRLARTETLTAANSRNVEEALRWLEIWEQWSRRLEVGALLRKFELRPYQQMQATILRKKLELLEHELEHPVLDHEVIQQLVQELTLTSQRLSYAFRT